MRLENKKRWGGKGKSLRHRSEVNQGLMMEMGIIEKDRLMHMKQKSQGTWLLIYIE